jgi:hypothetical protein
MSRAWQMLFTSVAACLLLSTVGCGSSSTGAATTASPSPTSARDRVYMAHLVLTPQHPAHVTFHIAAGELRVVASVQRPLVSYALERVSALPASHPLADGGVQLLASTHSQGGQTVSVLRTKQPLAAGWYRLELVGRGEIVQLSIEGR